MDLVGRRSGIKGMQKSRSSYFRYRCMGETATQTHTSLFTSRLHRRRSRMGCDLEAACRHDDIRLGADSGGGALRFLYAFWPRRWNRYFRGLNAFVPRSLTAAPSRVPARVDPEQSQVNYYGPNGLMVAVYVTVENTLDLEVRLKKLALDVEVATQRLPCRFLQFHPLRSLDQVTKVGNIAVPARQAIEGWVFFQCNAMRVSKFKRFVFCAQAIGEPEQVYIRLNLMTGTMPRRATLSLSC